MYADVIVKAQPWHALSLFQYLDLIYRAYMDFLGHSWLTYEQNFHMRASIHMNMHWGEAHPGLWLQTMTAWPLQGERFDSGHLIRKSGQVNSSLAGAGQVVQPNRSAGTSIHGVPVPPV